MYYNFALPDIIFLHMQLKDLIALPENMQADVLLKPSNIDALEYTHWDSKYMLDLDAGDLLVRIETLFT